MSYNNSKGIIYDKIKIIMPAVDNIVIVEKEKKPLPKGLVQYGIFKKTIPKGTSKEEVRHKWLQFRLDNKLDEYNEASVDLNEEQKCFLEAKANKKKITKEAAIRRMLNKTHIVEDNVDNAIVVEA
jgi:hypothetical protein